MPLQRERLLQKKERATLEFKSKFFDQLTTRELYEIVRARTTIFLLEQRIICQDFDGVDYDALHCFLEEDGQVRAYMRAYRTEDGHVKIGRVLSIVHGQGLGSRLMKLALPEIKRSFGSDAVVINAQKHALGFYEKIGFVVTSEEFLEEGIPHVAMEYK